MLQCWSLRLSKFEENNYLYEICQIFDCVLTSTLSKEHERLILIVNHNKVVIRSESDFILNTF